MKDKFGLSAQGKNDPLVQFDQLALSGISCDLLKQEAEVGLVALHKAQVKVERDKKDRMDLFAAIEQALKPGENAGEKSSNADALQPKQDGEALRPWVHAWL
ncbi:hypothetical protein [uncultured Desulfobacter sp.]|uniref:hypothetical protein n=1 Tax=uncultured Desulfobacter sp. TaxID=240139 RepID=UPI002AAC4520|nr:hypothetical protein [uncultured Desulfobacter sp.]